jgi:glycosyltransferase involved in cell wall biosynthesis
VLEALACGTPVVASSVGGVPEQVIDGHTGMLSASGDASALARSVVTILTQPDLGERMGGSAARDARARFGSERMAESYLEWYRAIIEHWNGNAHLAPHHDRDAVT